MLELPGLGQVPKSLQGMCMLLVAEFSKCTLQKGSVEELSEFIKNQLRDDRLPKSELYKLYRVILGTAVSCLNEARYGASSRFNVHAFRCALRVINDIFEKLETKNSQDLTAVLHSILTTCVMINEKEVSTVELEEITKFISRYVSFMLNDATTRKDLFSDERKGGMAVVVSDLLHKLSTKTMDMRIRTIAGNTLLELVKPWDESLKIITAFLPGICCQTTELVRAEQNANIVNIALKVFGTAVTTCLNDDVMPGQDKIKNATAAEQQSKLLGLCRFVKIKEDIDPIKECSEKVECLLSKICATLVRHQEHRIRHALLTLLDDIYGQCTISLASQIEDLVIDTVVLTMNDPYEEISTLSGKIRERLLCKAKFRFMNRLKERLYSISVTLPNEIKARGDVDGCLKQLLGVLLAIGNDDANFLFGRTIPNELTLALSSALHLNIRRLRLCSEVPDSEDVLGMINSLPLLHDIEKKTVQQIATLLVKDKRSHALLDCIYANVQRTDQSEKLIGNYLLVAYMLRAAHMNNVELTDSFIDALHRLVERAVVVFGLVNIHRPPRDDHIEDDYDEHGADSCLIVVLLAFCAGAFSCTPSVFLCRKLMNETLFVLFEWTKSSYILCAEGAEYALKAAALGVGEADTSALCVTYGKFLLPKIAICLRSYSINRRTPCVLSALLDHCNSPEIFDNARHVVEELLLAVDVGSQERLILTLRALLSFAAAVGKWFPDVRPQKIEKIEFDEDNPTQESPKPGFVVAVNNVLKRTKHLLFSAHLPIRLLILEIVDKCLKDLQHFPDEYLPMIHENWPAVLDCLLDKDLAVRHEAFQVIVTMSELSGSFFYRRFIPDAWPSVRKFMLERSSASANAKGVYFYSSAYKFQKIVLENLGTILGQIEARNADWRSVKEVAEVYCDVSQPEILQNASKNLVLVCETKLKEND